MLCGQLFVDVRQCCDKLSFVVLSPFAGLQVEHLGHFCLWSKVVRTAVRTELVDQVEMEAGILDLAIMRGHFFHYRSRGEGRNSAG